MNQVNHSPNKKQKKLIEVIKKYHKNDFITNRITKTMLKKSIVDARIPFKNYLDSTGVLNFIPIKKFRDHVSYPVVIMNEYGIDSKMINFYAAQTRGDTRFSIDCMDESFSSDDLVYITVKNSTLVFIKLAEYDNFEPNLIDFFVG